MGQTPTRGLIPVEWRCGDFVRVRFWILERRGQHDVTIYKTPFGVQDDPQTGWQGQEGAEAEVSQCRQFFTILYGDPSEFDDDDERAQWERAYRLVTERPNTPGTRLLVMQNPSDGSVYVIYIVDHVRADGDGDVFRPETDPQKRKTKRLRNARVPDWAKGPLNVRLLIARYPYPAGGEDSDMDMDRAVLSPGRQPGKSVADYFHRVVLGGATRLRLRTPPEAAERFERATGEAVRRPAAKLRRRHLRARPQGNRGGVEEAAHLAQVFSDKRASADMLMTHIVQFLAGFVVAQKDEWTRKWVRTGVLSPPDHTIALWHILTAVFGMTSAKPQSLGRIPVPFGQALRVWAQDLTLFRKIDTAIRNLAVQKGADVVPQPVQDLLFLSCLFHVLSPTARIERKGPGTNNFILARAQPDVFNLSRGWLEALMQAAAAAVGRQDSIQVVNYGGVAVLDLSDTFVEPAATFMKLTPSGDEPLRVSRAVAYVYWDMNVDIRAETAEKFKTAERALVAAGSCAVSPMTLTSWPRMAWEHLPRPSAISQFLQVSRYLKSVEPVPDCLDAAVSAMFAIPKRSLREFLRDPQRIWPDPVHMSSIEARELRSLQREGKWRTSKRPCSPKEIRTLFKL